MYSIEELHIRMAMTGPFNHSLRVEPAQVSTLPIGCMLATSSQPPKVFSSDVAVTHCQVRRPPSSGGLPLVDRRSIRPVRILPMQYLAFTYVVMTYQDKVYACLWHWIP